MRNPGLHNIGGGKVTSILRKSEGRAHSEYLCVRNPAGAWLQTLRGQDESEIEAKLENKKTSGVTYDKIL